MVLIRWNLWEDSRDRAETVGLSLLLYCYLEGNPGNWPASLLDRAVKRLDNCFEHGQAAMSKHLQDK